MKDRMPHAGSLMACAVVGMMAVALGVSFPSSARAQQPDIPRTAENKLAPNVVFERTVTVDVTGMTLRDAIRAIADRAGIRVHYQREIVESIRALANLRLEDERLDDAFAKLFVGTNLSAVATAHDAVAIVAAPREVVIEDRGTIVGRVIDARTRRTIPVATIFLDESSQGLAAAEDGSFRIMATSGKHLIHVRAVGFARATREVQVTIGQTTSVEIALGESANVLNEVIVTGTVVETERKSLPTPITVLTAEDIEKRGITRVDQLFRGAVNGIVAAEQGSEVYSSGEAGLGGMVKTKMFSRGSSNLNGAPNPIKTYVDGVELVDPSYLGAIDVTSIERIEIITGPQAATIYGSGALGGVMQIFTKRGSGASTPHATVRLQYGILQSNQSGGGTPSHRHTLNVTGGSGPEFTYAGSASYNYTGQWQPNLYSRMYGGSAGGAYTQGPVRVNGSISVTGGKNGTGGSPYTRDRYLSGAWAPYYTAGIMSPTEGGSSNQAVSVTIDYHPISIWQHAFTIGRTENLFDLMPVSPSYETPDDSLFRTYQLQGTRTSGSYNTTIMPRFGALSSNFTVGVTGSWGENITTSGELANKNATSFIDPRIISTPDDDNWGLFGNLQLGWMDQLFFLAGVRAEQSPAYGEDHKIDWTPTMGMTYVREYGDFTVKLLGSYGRATRKPDPEDREQKFITDPNVTPPGKIGIFEAPQLRPEYERGYQGGFELYFGNIGSFTLNRYKQRVTDLILPVTIDSTLVTLFGLWEEWLPQQQHQNIATMDKHGWEFTAAANVGPVSLRGTYSWNDSKISWAPDGSGYSAGQTSTQGAPTHSGSGVASYAYGPTTLTATVNWIGAILRSGTAHPLLVSEIANARLPMYIMKSSQVSSMYSRPGYAKVNLVMSQRLSSRVSATLNVINLANSFGSESDINYPALGRQTMIGVAVRFP